MYQKAVETVEKYNMINDGDSIVVGLSGGADSCALTMFLAGLIKKYGIKITGRPYKPWHKRGRSRFGRSLCQSLL